MMERTLARNSISGINFVVCVLRYPSISLSLSPSSPAFCTNFGKFTKRSTVRGNMDQRDYIGLKRFRRLVLNYER